MKVFITKYALTKGIFAEEVEVCIGVGGREFVKSKTSNAYYHNPDYHKDVNDAISKAIEMKNKKLDSLEKEIERIHKLEFNENTVG